MIRALAVLLLSVWPALAFSQGAIQQSGVFIPGHLPVIASKGILSDGGTSTNGFISNVGVQNPGNGICQNNGPITGSFSEICLGFTGSTPTITATGPGFTGSGIIFNIKGTQYQFPGSGPCVGCGTMALQNANAVAISGGTIDGTTIGASTPAASTFTSMAVPSGVASGASLYGGLNGVITYTGSQGPPGTVQYGLAIMNSIDGAVTSQVINANEFVLNDDTVNCTGAYPANTCGVNWTSIRGNVGRNEWAPSTTYSIEQTVNNGGLIYQVAACGSPCTSAGSGGPTGTGSGIVDGNVTWNYLSADFSGSRAGLSVELNILSPNDPNTPNDGYRQWVAIQTTTTVDANQGGTGFNGNSAGYIYGPSAQVFAQNGATYLSGVVGGEIDVGINTGASSTQRTGIQISAAGNNQGVYYDDGYVIGARGGSPGFSVGWAIHGKESYAIASGGAIFQYVPRPPGSLAGAGLIYANPSQALGYDLSGLEFSTAAIRSTGGTAILGSGAMEIQSLSISTSGAIVSIDPSGGILSGATVGTSSGGYQVGDHVFEKSSGSVLDVATVDGSGDIQTFSVVYAGSYIGSAPSNPVTLYGGTGGGTTANLSWTAAASLSLAPSGADILLNSINAISTSATAGFVHLPHSAGTPIGTPANTTPGCEWNTSSHTMNCYDGSSWYHQGFSSGAG